ncbi:MAG TPA: hypothetical protein VFS83_17165 [Ktedonobacterales bacterium]|nr:hypothetical protein [Ktedonobacterales bacterium]
MKKDTSGLAALRELNPEQQHLLSSWAARYVWWKTPAEALRYPERIIAQVMDIGDYDDVQKMLRAFGEATPRYILRHAEAGMFSSRSWAYWHYRLGLAAPGQVPPLPQRRVS